MQSRGAGAGGWGRWQRNTGRPWSGRCPGKAGIPGTLVKCTCRLGPCSARPAKLGSRAREKGWLGTVVPGVRRPGLHSPAQGGGPVGLTVEAARSEVPSGKPRMLSGLRQLAGPWPGTPCGVALPSSGSGSGAPVGEACGGCSGRGQATEGSAQIGWSPFTHSWMRGARAGRPMDGRGSEPGGPAGTTFTASAPSPRPDPCPVSILILLDSQIHWGLS